MIMKFCGKRRKMFNDNTYFISFVALGNSATNPQYSVDASALARCSNHVTY